MFPSQKNKTASRELTRNPCWWRWTT